MSTRKRTRLHPGLWLSLTLLLSVMLAPVTVGAKEGLASQGLPSSVENYNLYYTTADFTLIDDGYESIDEEGVFTQPLSGQYTYVWYMYEDSSLALFGINTEKVTGDFTIPSKVTFKSNETYDPGHRYTGFVEANQDTEYPVKEIGSISGGKFTSLTIPASVTSIGKFADCSNLKTLTLPGSVKIFGDRCFEGCAALEEVVLEEGIESIGERMFCNCRSLKKVTLPNTLKSIGSQTFANCISLTTINDDNVLPASITSIDAEAFARCAFTEITLPANLSKDEYGYEGPFGGDTYLNCQNLTTIKVAEGGNTAYYAQDGILYYKGTDNINRMITYPAGKTAEEVTIPANTWVARNCFADNTHIKKLTVEDGVTFSEWAVNCSETANIKGTRFNSNAYFREQDFTNEIPLKTVIFKGGATVGYSCFVNCENLDTVIFETDDPVTLSNRSFVECQALKTFTFPENYRFSLDENYGGYNGRGEGVFDLCSNLETIKLYQSTDVTSGASLIDASFFTQCNNLTKFEVIAKEGYTPEDGKGCSVDENGVLFDSTKSILTAWPTALETESYSVPASVNTIKSNAFYTVKGPKVLTISDEGENVQVQDYAFDSTALNSNMDPSTESSMESITFGKRVTSIGKRCFAKLQHVKTFDLSKSSITEVPDGAFERCFDAESILLPDSVTTICGGGFSSSSPVGAFSNCNSLKTLTIPAGVTKIDVKTFNSCEALESIVIPKGVTKIGNCAFIGCYNLVKVTIEGTDVTIEDNAFTSSGSKSSLKTLTFYVQKGSAVETWLKDYMETEYYQSDQDWICRYIGEFVIRFVNDYTYDPSVGEASSLVLETSVKGSNVALKDALPKGAFPVAAAIDGYTFAGWYTDRYPTDTSVAATLTDTLSEDTIYYASYDYVPKTFTLKLYSDGKLLDTLTVEEYAMLSELLPKPVKTGYTLKGWSFSSAAKTPDELHHIYEDSSLYAVWEANPSSGSQSGQNPSQGSGQTQSGSSDTGKAPAVGTTDTTGDYAVTQVSNGTFEAEYTGKTAEGQTNVKIADTIKVGGVDCEVTAIADNAFADNKTMETVTIPATVTEIGDNAFKNCEKLKKVEIPKETEEIGSGAFNGCKSMTAVKFKGKKVTKIGDNAFAKCPKLTKVVVPDSVTTIGKNAFSGDKKLGNITINGNTVKKVGKNALKGIKKDAVVTIKAKTAKQYDKVVKMIKKAGNKKLKFKHKKK